MSPTPQCPIRWTRVLLFAWDEKPYQKLGSTQKQIRNKVTLTFSVRHLNPVFVLRVWNFLRDGPLNHCVCLTINVYKL